MKNRVDPEGGMKLEPKCDRVDLVSDLVGSDESGVSWILYGGECCINRWADQLSVPDVRTWEISSRGSEKIMR